MTDEIRLTVEGGIATVTIDRPDAFNAVTHDNMEELIEIFDRTDVDDDVRVVVFTGVGKAFCTGADLSGGADTFSFGDDDLAHRDSGGRFTTRAVRSLKPLIAAVNGHAVGFGASMTLPMDFRVVAAEAKLGFPFVARGIVPDGAASWFLPKIVGPTVALDWLLTGRTFSAAEALETGLVNSVHPRVDVLDEAYRVANSVVTQAAPISVALTRQLVWQHLGSSGPMAAHRMESAGIAYTGRGTDASEGIAAFREKRPPRWSQRVSEDMPRWFSIADDSSVVAAGIDSTTGHA